MKKLFLLLLIIILSNNIIAQTNNEPERVKPTFGVTVERECSLVMIDKQMYGNVVIELKAADIGDIFTEGVKVTVTDGEGKKIYKKRFSKSLLYAFSDGRIQVGKGNAITQIQIYKNSQGRWEGEIKEKGIY